jgi:hypothetical protein
MNSIDQIRFVTGHYYELHGLRWVAWGVVCFAIAAEDAGAISTLLMLTVVLPVGLAVFIGASWYYMRNFGIVQSPTGSPLIAASNLIFVPLLLAGFFLDKWLDVRPFISPFVFALWLATAFWWAGRKYRIHYLWVAIAMSVANIGLAFVDFPVGSPWLRRGVITWTLAGFGFIVGGWLDHLLIVRTLGHKVSADV